MRKSTDAGGVNEVYFMPYNHQLRGDTSTDDISFTELLVLVAVCLPVASPRVFDICFDAMWKATAAATASSCEHYSTAS